MSGGGYGWAAPRQAELKLSYTELREAIVDTYIRQQRYDIGLNPMRKWAERPCFERVAPCNQLTTKLHLTIIKE